MNKIKDFCMDVIFFVCLVWIFLVYGPEFFEE